MATIIGNPPAGGSSGLEIKVIIGAIIGLILLTLFFVFVFPAFIQNTVTPGSNTTSSPTEDSPPSPTRSNPSGY